MCSNSSPNTNSLRDRARTESAEPEPISANGHSKYPTIALSAAPTPGEREVIPAMMWRDRNHRMVRRIARC